MSEAQIAAIREAADRFHRILSSFVATRLLTVERARGTRPELLASMSSDLLAPAEIEQIAADGFEACVRLLAAAGASDVTIHECNPTETP